MELESPTVRYCSVEINMNEMLVRVDEVRFMGNVKTRMILPPGSSKSVYRARRSVKRV